MPPRGALFHSFLVCRDGAANPHCLGLQGIAPCADKKKKAGKRRQSIGVVYGLYFGNIGCLGAFLPFRNFKCDPLIFIQAFVALTLDG
jgi:hypothetical protein